jgi:hypothetical protein
MLAPQTTTPIRRSRAGRPSIPVEAHRTERLSVYFTHAELADLHEKAAQAKVSPSEYLRRTSVRPMSLAAAKPLMVASNAITKIGGLLKLIASSIYQSRRPNFLDEAGLSNQMNQLTLQLAELQSQIEQLKSEVTHG